MDAGRQPALTYSPHGGSVDLDDTRVPAGFRVFRHEAVIGVGREQWAAASDAVLEWALQRGAGITVSTARVIVGDDVTITIPLLGFLPVRAFTRVLTIVDEPDRRGFAYGTLPGHPECGEEAFLVSIDGTETVRVIVQGFSRPARGLWVLVAPALRLVQAMYTGRYLRALKQH